MKGARGFGDLFAAQQLAVVFAFDACHDVPSAPLRLAGPRRDGGSPPALRQKTIPHLDDVLEDFGERSLLSVIVQLNYYFTLRAPG
jgi:hypothetical protein